MSKPQAVALFSGGLDSILAARVMQEQGLEVRCLHFVTPFFGKPHLVAHWSDVYGVAIDVLDVGDDYIKMLREYPKHGYGKVMNPCIDCKILMMREAKKVMESLGAKCILSGEVLGQRPMSQRKDALNVIRRDAGVRESLLRPLSAKHLDPTLVETSGLVDRAQLYGMFGRGRREQLDLAKQLGIAEIPTPAGGCKLAEKENARRYWPVLTRLPNPTQHDFYLSNVGRQYWIETHWLSMGRDEETNLELEGLVRSGDVLLRLRDFTGPLGVLRKVTDTCDVEQERAVTHDAASLIASYSPKAVRTGASVSVLVIRDGDTTEVSVMPSRTSFFPWGEPSFEDVKETLKSLAREHEENRRCMN